MSMGDIIALNVGGSRFETTRQTLLRYPNSMLARMFDPETPFQPGIQRGDAYFFDRDPTYFRCILNFLRTGSLIVDSGLDTAGILHEAQFFGLEALRAEIQKHLDKARVPCQTVQDGETGPDTDWVTVKACQTRYTMTRQTLRRSALLAGLLDNGQVDEDGCLRIDEDPEDFRLVLKKMRHIDTRIPFTDGDEAFNVAQLATRLGLDGKSWRVLAKSKQQYLITPYPKQEY